MSVQQINARIKANATVTPNCYRLTLVAPDLCAAAQPGNFVMVKVSGGADPLLRRPLSIHRVDASAGVIELLYEVVGAGTEILARKKAGEQVSVIGPLGNTFSLDANTKRSPVVLVAGGMGVAPLMFLAQRLRAQDVTALIGGRTRTHVLCAGEFKKLGVIVRIATDDGSSGFHGRVTGLLERMLAEGAMSAPVVYGCGPRPMLKALSAVCRHQRIRGQVSLESHMACGIGACLGCVVQTTQGFKRVCKEGPVFDTSDLVW